MKILVTLLYVFCNIAAGSVVLLPEISTSWEASQIPPRLASIFTETETTVNLDSRADLIPGLPVRITIVSDANFIWGGTFCYDAGRLEISSTASLRLIVGTETNLTSSFFHNDYGVVPSDDSACPGGFILGPALPAFELIVPWSADLSQTRFVLSQHSTISGSDAYFLRSSVHVGFFQNNPRFSAILESIPEPGQSSLLSLGILYLLSLRRRAAHPRRHHAHRRAPREGLPPMPAPLPGRAYYRASARVPQNPRVIYPKCTK